MMQSHRRRSHRETDNWRLIAESARPLLEWLETHEDVVGNDRAEHARRVLVRHYLANAPALPPPKGPMIVKVVIPHNSLQASVFTEDRKINLNVAVSNVQRRLNKDTTGFFEATYEPGGVLELGERVPDQKW